MADRLGQTITVVNKSGKIVSSSKHIANVFKEARAAYRERKAELQAQRSSEPDAPEKPRVHRKPVPSSAGRPQSTPSSPRPSASPTTASHKHSKHDSRHGSGDDRSQRSGRHRSDRPRQRPAVERGYSDTFYGAARPRRVKTDAPTSPLQFMRDAEFEPRGKELVLRRHSYPDQESNRALETRSRQDEPSEVDMDLAYGELPPPLPTRSIGEQDELKTKVTTLNRLLEEAQCLHHSATTMIKTLEKNPDAMAAVALTLAEISNLVTKLGPPALMALKTSFPAVVALLVSPEFLIAAGVGVGITVVALGGYKIVKKIRAKKDAQKAAGNSEELEELDVDINSIETWRRGIADVEGASVGTSVDGELITPGAAADLRRQGKLPPSDKAKPQEERDSRKKREKEEKKHKEAREKQDKADKKKQKHEQEKEDKRSKKDKAAKEKKKAEDDMLL